MSSTPAARILSVLPHAGGNVPPTLAVARELADRGHDVRFLGHEQLRGVIERAGFRFEPFRHARRWSATVERPGVRSMLAWMPLASDRGTGRDLSASLAREPADLLLLDCMVPGALRAARRSGLRAVMLMHTFSAYWQEQWGRGSPMGVWLRLTAALPTRRATLPELAVLMTAPELDLVSPRFAVPGRRFVQTGPALASVPSGPVERPADAPILVSLSTISYPGQVAMLTRIVEAIGELPIRAVVTTGPSIDAARLSAPPNVELRSYVPHAELMPQVRMVVGHGGHGTTMTALAHDLPVLVMPMSRFADQALVGAAVAREGAGAVLSKDASVEQVREAIAAVLAASETRVAAARLGDGIRVGRGASRAATAIEELLD